MNRRAETRLRNIREKSENTNAILRGKGGEKATDHYVKMSMILKGKKKKKISIQCLTWILPQNFKTESLTNRMMVVLTCAKHIYTQQIHTIICSSRQTYLAKNVHFIYLLWLKKKLHNNSKYFFPITTR